MLLIEAHFSAFKHGDSFQDEWSLSWRQCRQILIEPMNRSPSRIAAMQHDVSTRYVLTWPMCTVVAHLHNPIDQSFGRITISI